MSLASGDRCGPYEIIKSIGQGGMGEVFCARDARLERFVAIKVLPAEVAGDRDRLSRFEQEARATGALNHPNILSVFDLGVTQEGAPYIVCELLEGETLRERLDRGPIPHSKVLQYAVEIARGLAAAHQRGIVHRDLKPENIFITSDGRVKILDFGLAKLLTPESQHDAPTTPQLHHRTEAGVVLGTVGYMSPEQVRGKPVDHRSDVFAFGVMVLEMFSGVRAFRAESTVETLHLILNADPAGLGDHLPRNVSSLIRRCLEKNPADRFQSVQDLSFALEALTFGSSEPATREAVAPARRWRLAAVGGAIALVVLLTALAVILERQRRAAVLLVDTAAPTFRQITFRLGYVTAARFAPDGHTVLYSAAWEDNPIEVFTTRLSGSESRSMALPGAGVLSISSQEEIAISQECMVTWGQCMEGTLARVSLAGGAPREILANVASAEWPPDGKALAVVRPVEGRWRLEYPLGTVLYSTEGWITSPRFKADGKEIAFCDHPTLGDVGGNISVVDLAGRRRIASDGWKSLMRLAWSPQGEIWASGSRDDFGEHLFAVDGKGAVRRILLAPTAVELLDVARNGDVLLSQTNARARMLIRDTREKREHEVSWFDWSTASDISSDGKGILFYEWGKGVGGHPTVYLRRADRADAVRLGEGKALSLSPDGAWALAHNEGGDELSLLPARAGERRVLPRGDVKIYYSASWFPDSKKVLFVGEGSDRTPHTFIQEIDGGVPRAVGPGGLRGVMVAPDGRSFAGYDADGTILRSTLEGAGVAIRGSEPGDSLMSWSSDGAAVFVRAASERAVPIIRLDIASGRREQWDEIVPADSAGFIGFDSDGVKITPDGRTVVYTYWRVLSDVLVAKGLGRAQ